MELYRTLGLPQNTYVALIRDDSHVNIIPELYIGHGKDMKKQNVTGYNEKEDGRMIMYTKEGYNFTRQMVETGRPHTLVDAYGICSIVTKADYEDPMWDFLSGSSKPASSEWSEVDDSILRGWKKDAVLLCEVFPKRSYTEIRDRLSILLKQ